MSLAPVVFTGLVKLNVLTRHCRYNSFKANLSILFNAHICSHSFTHCFLLFWVWTQVIVSARQVLYQWALAPAIFFIEQILNKCLLLFEVGRRSYISKQNRLKDDSLSPRTQNDEVVGHHVVPGSQWKQENKSTSTSTNKQQALGCLLLPWSFLLLSLWPLFYFPGLMRR